MSSRGALLVKIALEQQTQSTHNILQVENSSESLRKSFIQQAIPAIAGTSQDNCEQNVESQTAAETAIIVPETAIPETQILCKEISNNELETYLTDSDCSIKDKDYVPQSSMSESDNEYDLNNSVESGTKKRTRWRNKDEATWKKNKLKRIKVEAKKPSPINCSKCRFKCTDKIVEENRVIICNHFWACEFNRRKDFILSNVESRPPERRRHKSESTKKPRVDSKAYFLEVNSIGKIRVCKSFFLSTLCISKEVVEHAFKNKGEGNLFIGEDKRGKNIPHNKTKQEDIDKVKEHIESFPLMESHYTRKSTQRKYLNCKLSIAKMHALYLEICEQDGSKPVSLITYRRIFCKNYNYSFFIPKKDQCQVCTLFKSSDPERKLQLDKNFQLHIERKEECNSAKTSDKERAISESNFVCCTFDLQCVLQIPSSDVSPMYYSRKICTYNLTVYELAPPNNAYCYAWTELHGKRGSLEIGSCIYNYINQLPSTVTELSLFSDTCSGQNRNKNISALLLFIVQRNPNITIIEQKFLESGHSHMEVDSMHSAIEKAQKFVSVYTLQDWLNIFRLARTKRSNKKPYTVKELKYSDFLDLENLSNLLIRNKSKNTEGEKLNWLKVKCFRYQKCNPGILEYRYDHKSDYKKVAIFGKGRLPNIKEIEIKSAYNKLRPISVKKKQDLLKLCRDEVIPVEFHHWYKSLPAVKDVGDTVPEPTIDDSDLDSE